MRKKSVFTMLTILLVTLVLSAASALMASQSPWDFLGTENYQLIDVGSGDSIAYSAMQDTDLTKIAKAKDNDPGLETKWRSKRPDVVPAFEPVELSTQINQLKSNMKSFSVNVADEDGIKTAKIQKIVSSGKSQLFLDTEFSPFTLVSSQEGSKYLLPTERGLWLIDPAKQTSTKISKDSFNNKTIAELAASAAKKEGGSLFWNDNPKFSPDAKHIAYITNRDCIEKGTSIWVQDVTTGDERSLIPNVAGEQYCIAGWVGNNNFLYTQHDGDLHHAFIGSLTGENKPVDVPTDGILALRDDGRIAYTTNSSAGGTELFVAQISSNGQIDPLYKKSIDCVHITYESIGFNKSGLELAYAYVVDDKGTVKIAVVNLKNQSDHILTDPPSKDRVMGDVKWLDNSRLLIHTQDVADGVPTISSWSYDVKKEEVK